MQKKGNTADKVSCLRKTKEIELSFVSLNRTVGDTFTFQSETELHPPDLSDSSYALSVQCTVSINDEIICEKEKLQNTVYFRETSKSENMTLNGSDMSLLQIPQSLKNKNDCVSVANTPPKMSMSATFVINTSSNKAMIEKRLKMTWLLPK